MKKISVSGGSSGGASFRPFAVADILGLRNADALPIKNGEDLMLPMVQFGFPDGMVDLDP